MSQPKWVRKTPPSKSGNYLYFVGEGSTRRAAVMDALQSVSESLGDQYLESSVEDFVEIINENKERRTVTRLKQQSKAESRFVFPADSWNNGSYFYILIGVSKIGESIGGPLSAGNFVWRSSLAPGWGQFYNKESKKGLLFSIGEVALIGAALYSFGQAGNEADNAELALLSGNLAQFNTFRQNEDNWRTTGTIFGISAGALWILNIIDAASTDKNLFASVQEKKGVGLLASGTRFGLKYSF